VADQGPPHIFISQLKLKFMTIAEVKEQLQEDILCVLEGMGIEEVLDPRDWDNLKDEVCNIIITNINNLNK